MNLSASIDAGGHRMRVTSFGLRDIYNSPFDTTDYLAFQALPDTIPDRFYIVRWTFEQGANANDRSSASGGDMKLAALPEKIFHVLDLLGFPMVFQIFPTVAEAEAAFENNGAGPN